MTELNLITRENTSTEEKLGILVSMHPADRYRYFDELVQSILSVYDCVIYYSDNPSDNISVNMDDIKLVVLAVTEKYITWNNSGFQSEALHAIRKEIPVLPIMLENGIVNLFNTRCGKFHYIDNSSGELTVESLEKINIHLGTIINGEMTQSVDDSKAKIFISYRKKDIHELNRLVSLIRSHPQSNQVQLWYDTSLNPGDDFNHAIIERIQNCDLFLMLVTPTILEQGNYVVRKEYPLARERNKTILPIMMQKTDRKVLNEIFPSLPKCISDNQIGAIYAKVLK